MHQPVSFILSRKGYGEFLKVISHKKIPPNPSVVEYLGFTPQNLWESPPVSLNLKYSTTALQGNRDCLGELPIAEIPTLDTEPSLPYSQCI